MEEAYVRLLCPECGKHWERTPGELPRPDEMFHCAGCHATRRLAEFARTEHDLRTMKQFA
jgi:hypothetical protein